VPHGRAAGFFVNRVDNIDLFQNNAAEPLKKNDEAKAVNEVERVRLSKACDTDRDEKLEGDLYIFVWNCWNGTWEKLEGDCPVRIISTNEIILI
jgi:hypothetical protein